MIIIIYLFSIFFFLKKSHYNILLIQTIHHYNKYIPVIYFKVLKKKKRLRKFKAISINFLLYKPCRFNTLCENF